MVVISNNKRIAKNTIVLYFRLLVTLVVSLYTSRVIIDVLGVSDYGLYNLVCGTVTLFAFVNGAMSGCTQRFLNIAMGKGDQELCKKTFSTSLTLHFVLIIFFILFMEIIGNYFLNYVLNIPIGRETVAVIIFHLSLIGFSLNFLYMPFEAAIVAHERMDFYAYLSIFDVCSKLGIVYLLNLFRNTDSLIVYSALMVFSQLILFFIYVVTCLKSFNMCSLKLSKDKILLKEMSSYTFWNILGQISYIVTTQAYNVVYNIFCGTTINAARSIAVQVSGLIGKFTGNFQVASYPQIVKLYAANDIMAMYELVTNVAKYAFYLYIFFAIPLFFSVDFLLDIWLTTVPDYTSLFIKAFLIRSAITTIGTSADRAIVATGKVKWLNIFTSINELFFLGVSYYLLHIGVGILYVIPVIILPGIMLFSITLFLMHKYLTIDPRQYINKVLLNCVIVLLTAVLPLILLSIFLGKGAINGFIMLTSSVIITIVAISIGVGKDMRNKILTKVKFKFLK